MAIHPADRIIERTDHSWANLNAAFGAVLEEHPSARVLDVGAGDSDFAEVSIDGGRSVARLDPDYATNPPAGQDWHVGSAEAIPFPDKSFDAVISAFLMQHLSPEQQAEAIREMIRVTVPHSEESLGAVGIYPVYQESKLDRQLARDGLSHMVVQRLNYEAFERLPIGVKRKYPTIWIPHTTLLDGDTIDRLSRSIAESGALNRRQNLRDIGRRMVMRSQQTNISHVR
ncbi:TPA: hypothetical protein DIV49_02825 [Candidatus Saccharibacteria bacterium]|nr:hypothetical protein [Candidatus Saccharibacteria bacterium]HRJ90948.1 class I SAM-dependent methyltransferase [Candidatus Saccharibacteria bacterium]